MRVLAPSRALSARPYVSEFPSPWPPRFHLRCAQIAHDALLDSLLGGTWKNQVVGHHHVELISRPDLDRRRAIHPVTQSLLAQSSHLRGSRRARVLARRRPLIGLVVPVRS